MTRLLIIADDFPLPANSGGRVDIWRRMEALHDAGFDLALLAWYDQERDGPPDEALIHLARSVCVELQFGTVRRGGIDLARRLVHFGRLSSHAASRWVGLDRPAVLAWARAFRPDVILLDRLYGVAAAQWLARELDVPWLYRSHNREAEYMQGQQRCAPSLKAKAGLMANQIGLKALEQTTVCKASVVLDISASDAAHWQAQGQDHVQWLPPVADQKFAAAIAAQTEPAEWDLMYFGNLYSPNNLEALDWWVTKVLPLLPQRTLRIAVAGSRPSQLARALLARDERITLIADPADIAPCVGSARVLVNPMRSGSGVNLKSVDMLCTRAHLVSTSVGVGGLPSAAAACFDVRDDAPGFAQALAHALGKPLPDRAALAARAAALAAFSSSAVAHTFVAACQLALQGHRAVPND